MSEFKGTKGKWNACFNWSEKNIEIGTPEQEKIALVSKRFDFPESNANAQLIACAPEMLEMLNKVKDLFTKRQMPNEHEANMFSVTINELIEKATTL